MKRRIKVFYMAGLALLVLASLLIMGNTSYAQRMSTWAKLQKAAADGDQWAQGYLDRVKVFLRSRGLQDPPKEKQVLAGDAVNGTRIWFKGLEPFYLKIYNRQEFANVQELDAYITNRKEALTRLARENPSRQIEVAISFSTHTELAKVWELRDDYGIDVDEMLVYIYLRGKKHSVMLVGDPKDPGERSYIDLTQPLDPTKSRPRELLPAQVFRKKGNRAGELEFRVSWIRGKLLAANAEGVDTLASIMLVDPVSDLLDQHHGRAVDVKVVDVPHLLEAKSDLENRPQRGPISAQPTPLPRQEAK